MPRALVVHGDADGTVPVEDGAAFAAAIRDCEHRVVPGGDHWFAGAQTLVLTFMHRLPASELSR